MTRPAFTLARAPDATPGRTPIAPLADVFAPQGDCRALAARLAARADEHRRALARGGARADFARWQAALDALQAALDILAHRESTPPGTCPAPQGDAPWTSLSAPSIRP